MPKKSTVGKKLKLKAALPKFDEGFDGLQDIAGEVIDDQHTTHIVVAILSCADIESKDYGDLIEGKMSIAHIEAVVDSQQEAALRLFLKKRQEERTGREPLFDE